MCGEHSPGIMRSSASTGSSPHVRGARHLGRGRRRRAGIIPACAGSTSPVTRGYRFARDHPRMCGEHSDTKADNSSMTWIIPACAGSTRKARPKPHAGRDHPRMCGEHASKCGVCVHYEGSSPHVRGAQCSLFFLCLLQGIIPACAGSTPWPTLAVSCAGDHPRMCGEHGTRQCDPTRMEGSSPHVRGAPSMVLDVGTNIGIIPACAGSTGREGRAGGLQRDHPRMCGEHSVGGAGGLSVGGSSPHVRGARLSGYYLSWRSGIIPACAGSTKPTPT